MVLPSGKSHEVIQVMSATVAKHERCIRLMPCCSIWRMMPSNFLRPMPKRAQQEWMEHSTWPTSSVITLPCLEVELGITDVFFISCPRMAKWLVPFVVSERKSIASEVRLRFTLVKGSEVELLFIVFQILKFDTALKRGMFVVFPPAL